MIRLVKTDRKPNFQGVTPAFIAGGTLFFVVVLAAHFAGRRFHADLTPCVFRIITHKPCFLCGGTRASLLLASGKPVKSFKRNPLVATVLIYASVAMILKFGFARKLSFKTPFQYRPLQWALAITLVIANWLYIIRTIP